MTTSIENYELPKDLAFFFSRQPDVQAVALGGSTTSALNDPHSDIDIYVFSNTIIPIEIREEVAYRHRANPVNIDLHFWDTGDAWFDGKTGIEVDIMYWNPKWIEDQINLRMSKHRASLGYSTSICHTIKHCIILFDPDVWLEELRKICNRSYPEELRENIIRLNYPVLRNVIPAYLYQIEKAVMRKDLVSINHRISAFFASYFDILYALNRITHPGEKRLVELTSKLCPLIPRNMETEIEAILHAAAHPTIKLIALINKLIDHLDELLLDENFSHRLKQYKV